METANIIAMAKKMRMFQAEKEELEERVKFLNIQLDDIRLKQIPDAMAELELKSLTIEDVGRVQLANDCYATIADKAAGYAWLEENGYGGLIVPYVQPSTFKAAVKEAMKAGQEFPEELFRIQPFVRASIVKA